MFNSFCTEKEDSTITERASEMILMRWVVLWIMHRQCLAILLKGIPCRSYQTVLFKPWLAILDQQKYLPLRFRPITIELSLVDEALDLIISVFWKYAVRALPGGAFTYVSTSKTWQTQNAQAKCDLVSLDSGLNKSYIKLLEEGKELTLNYNTFISQYQSIINQTAIYIKLQGH